MCFIQIDFNLKFNYEGMTQQVPKPEEEAYEIAETLEINIGKVNEEKQQESMREEFEIISIQFVFRRTRKQSSIG
jgi:hypothetical protein